MSRQTSSQLILGPKHRCEVGALEARHCVIHQRYLQNTKPCPVGTAAVPVSPPPTDLRLCRHRGQKPSNADSTGSLTTAQLALSCSFLSCKGGKPFPPARIDANAKSCGCFLLAGPAGGPEWEDLVALSPDLGRGSRRGAWGGSGSTRQKEAADGGDSHCSHCLRRVTESSVTGAGALPGTWAEPWTGSWNRPFTGGITVEGALLPGAF